MKIKNVVRFLPLAQLLARSKIKGYQRVASALTEDINNDPVNPTRADEIYVQSLKLGPFFRGLEMDHGDNPLGLFLEYEEGVGVEQVYSDIQSLNMGKRLLKQGFNYRLHGPIPDAHVILDADGKHNEHFFRYPLWAHFHELKADNPVQVNDLTVRGVGNPNEDTISKIEKVCAKENATCKVKPDDWRAPSFIVNATWEGSNFDKKALFLYKEIRSLVFDTHKEETLKQAEELFDRAYNGEGKKCGLYTNQEDMHRDAYLITDLDSGFGCTIPFEHKGKPAYASIHYAHFKGR